MPRDARQVLSELLVLRAQGGDEGAFAELYRLWRGDLERFAMGRVGDVRAAEEVAQTAWIAIARGLRRVDDPACFLSWALRIVERRVADYVRRRQKERREEAVWAETAAVAESAEPNGRGMGAVGERLREEIRQMDPPSRELLNLFYVTGLTVAEIAELLGIPAGTVKSRLFHVREKLKRQLERSIP